MSYRTTKKPIQEAAIFAQTDQKVFVPVKVNSNGNIYTQLVATYGISGETAPVRSNPDGRLEVLTGFDGTNYLPLRTDNTGKLQVLAGYTGRQFTYIKTDNNGRLEVANTPLQGPISKASLFNVQITDSQVIFANDLSPTFTPCIFRMYVCFDSALTLKAKRTSGGISVEELLNGGNQLNANTAYMFDIIVDSGETINLIPVIDGTGTTTAIALKISVVEKPGVD